MLKGEVDESMEKVEITLAVIEAFKQCYLNHKAKLASYFKTSPVIKWEFAPPLVFHRYDRFLERLKIVLVCRLY